MAFGALTALSEMDFSRKIEFYRRFREVRGDGWYIGRDRWDGVTITP